MVVPKTLSPDLQNTVCKNNCVKNKYLEKYSCVCVRACLCNCVLCNLKVLLTYVLEMRPHVIKRRSRRKRICLMLCRPHLFHLRQSREQSLAETQPAGLLGTHLPVYRVQCSPKQHIFQCHPENKTSASAVFSAIGCT